MKGNIQVPKGTRDFTSKVMFRRNYIFKKLDLALNAMAMLQLKHLQWKILKL